MKKIKVLFLVSILVFSHTLFAHRELTSSPACISIVRGKIWANDTIEFIKSKYPSHQGPVKPKDEDLHLLGDLYQDELLKGVPFDQLKSLNPSDNYWPNILASAADLSKLEDGRYSFVLTSAQNTLLVGHSHGKVGKGVPASCAGELVVSTLSDGRKVIREINNQSGTYQAPTGTLVYIIEKLSSIGLYQKDVEILHWQTHWSNLVPINPTLIFD